MRQYSSVAGSPYPSSGDFFVTQVSSMLVVGIAAVGRRRFQTIPRTPTLGIRIVTNHNVLRPGTPSKIGASPPFIITIGVLIVRSAEVIGKPGAVINAVGHRIGTNECRRIFRCAADCDRNSAKHDSELALHRGLRLRDGAKVGTEHLR